MSYEDLRGKTIIVTGGASGIGRATAILLGQQGANVGVLDLQNGDAVVREIEAAGGKAIAFGVDVTNSGAVEAAVKTIVERFGKIGGAANLAGWVGSQGWRGKAYALEVIEDADWDAMIAVNLTGVKNCVRAELRHFRPEGGGAIVNAASVAGQRGTPNNSPYAASKAAVEALSKAAAQEAGTRGIRVNAIAPGIIDTPMAAALSDRAEVEQRLVSRTALKRMGHADEVAKVLLFLLSDQAAYITSTTVNVDGGYQ